MGVAHLEKFMANVKCPICGATSQNVEDNGGGVYFCKLCFSGFCWPEAPSAPVTSEAQASASSVPNRLPDEISGLMAMYGGKKKERSLDTLSVDELKKIASEYEYGEKGRAKDPAKAFEYFKVAAEKGDSESMYKVAYAYENGIGVEESKNKAYFWYKEGQRAGNERCGRIVRERFAKFVVEEKNKKSGKSSGTIGGSVNAAVDTSKCTNEFSKLFMQLLPSIVRVGAGNSCGTGFIINKGYIATNAHVVLSTDSKGNTTYLSKYTLTFSPKLSRRAYTAKLVCYDKDQDVAILKCTDPNDFVDRAIKVGNSDEIIPGEDTFTIGNGKDYGLAFSKLSIGQAPISGKMFGKYHEIIQLIGSANPGNSGGPVFNMRGEVIGIITFGPTNRNVIYSTVPIDGRLQVTEQVIDTSVNGVCFAITSKTLKRVAKEINLEL